MGKQNIDLELLERESKAMGRAIQKFRPCTTKFLARALEEVNKNSSDFMVELEKILIAFIDEKCKAALNNAIAYQKSIQGVHDTWKDVDDKIAKTVKGGTKK